MARGRAQNSGKYHYESVQPKQPRNARPKQPLDDCERQTTSNNSSSDDQKLLSLQQKTLDCFTSAFQDVLEPSGKETRFRPLLQDVKTHLYNRDFSAAFGKREYLEVYAARWSASRALGYIEVFKEVFSMLHSGASSDISNLSSSTTSSSQDCSCNVVCLGGGAGAELCALAAAQQLTLPDQPLEMTFVDYAEWSNVLNALETTLTSSGSRSPYASAATKGAASKPLISPGLLTATFQHLDLLSNNAQQQGFLISIEHADLITITFTLNELYTTSVSKTQNLLLTLTTSARPGTLLLVVDSPGSYSTVTVNGNEKKYPMQWLLEHTLLITAPKVLNGEISKDKATSQSTEQQQAVWEKVTSTDSRWFRLPSGLEYPLELENMRYQMSLWRRL